MEAAPPSFQRHLHQNRKEWLILMKHYLAWPASKYPSIGFVAWRHCYAPNVKHPRLCFGVGTGSNAPDTLAKTLTADFRPFSNQLIDETVDYHTWLTSCSNKSLLITYITGISGTSPAVLCTLLAAWTMNARRRSGHDASMCQAETVADNASESKWSRPIHHVKASPDRNAVSVWSIRL